MADRRVFMLGSRSLLLDERRQASFEAGILISRKVFSEESEWKSESSYWLMKSEVNGSGKMTAHVGEGVLFAIFILKSGGVYGRHEASSSDENLVAAVIFNGNRIFQPLSKLCVGRHLTV
ncbi:hypothetical protein TNCV_4433531 [Trichonephila clavipes]|nr:hypothetical protein TNCV_4433531 [Trichonephila clavipes]